MTDYYGPTNKKATKVAVGIIAQENADPEPIKSWFSDADVRNNALIMEKLLAFIANTTPSLSLCPTESLAVQ
jgi:hypothetical protein